ncbi:MAG: hypothetical protein INH37_17745 [Myxococcaceae bacterium]|nr:hypothetical protein [Myxococcaceae bacterium]
MSFNLTGSFQLARGNSTLSDAFVPEAFVEAFAVEAFVVAFGEDERLVVFGAGFPMRGMVVPLRRRL